ncbi:unnamed protein product, partial [Heterotrigona itama]
MQLTQSETLLHVHCHCSPHVVGSCATTQLSRDMPRPPACSGKRVVVCPGIVVTYETGVIVDVNVPFENDFEALKNARLGKIAPAPRRRDAWERLNCAYRRLVAMGTWHQYNKNVNM